MCVKIYVLMWIERIVGYGFEVGDICVRMMEKSRGMRDFIPARFHKGQASDSYLWPYLCLTKPTVDSSIRQWFSRIVTVTLLIYDRFGLSGTLPWPLVS